MDKGHHSRWVDLSYTDGNPSEEGSGDDRDGRHSLCQLAHRRGPTNHFVMAESITKRRVAGLCQFYPTLRIISTLRRSGPRFHAFRRWSSMHRRNKSLNFPTVIVIFFIFSSSAYTGVVNGKSYCPSRTQGNPSNLRM